MKKQIITIAGLALLAVTSTAVSETSISEISLDSLKTYQSDEVKTCPYCRGSGTTGPGGDKCRPCKGKGLVKKNGQPLG